MAGDKNYDVIWIDRARLHLSKMENFKVDPNKVFLRSKKLLSSDPRKTAYDVVTSENDIASEFHGYYWTLIHNVIVVYEIVDNQRKVLIDAAFFANTAWAHYVFWNIDPEDWNDL